MSFKICVILKDSWGKKSSRQLDPVSSTLGAGRQLSHYLGYSCPTGSCFCRRPRSLPAGVACDGVPALVLVDVDALHVPLCEDVAGAVGQAWGERRLSHLSHTCCPPTRPGETRRAGSPGGLGGLAGCLSS